MAIVSSSGQAFPQGAKNGAAPDPRYVADRAIDGCSPLFTEEREWSLRFNEEPDGYVEAPPHDVFDTLQINLGSLYVNQFNKYGKIYRVYLQADEDARNDQHTRDLGCGGGINRDREELEHLAQPR